MKRFSLLLVLLFALGAPALSVVPPILHHQGRVAVDGTNFDGSGQFKFALVNGAGTVTYWSNDGTSSGGSEPSAAVPLTVGKGLYSVSLGDTTVANMTAIPATVFNNADVRLRVWFNDGANGSQLLTPDQRIAAAGYAMNAARAESVASNSISTANIVNGTVALSDLNLPNVDTRYAKRGVREIVVDVAGGGDFTTISDALAAISPSASVPYVLQVRPGLYRETVTLKDYVRLHGAGRDLVTIQPPSGATVGVQVNGLTHVAISGLTIRPEDGNLNAGLNLSGGANITVEDCRFTGILSAATASIGAGIVAFDSTVLASRCEFVNNGDETGVLLHNSRGLIAQSIFTSGTAMFGIRVENGGEAQVIGNDFSAHDHAIFASSGAPGKVIASGNRFTDMATGIATGNNFELVATGNVFRNTSGTALSSGGQAVVTGNEFRDCDSFAMVLEGDNAAVAGNLIQNCGPAGADAVFIGTPNALLSGNRFDDNASDVATTGGAFLVEKVGAVSIQILPETEVQIAPRLRSDAVAVGVSGAPVGPFQVAGKANIGNGVVATATQNQNVLNLMIGANADGLSNGIKFYEFTGANALGMSFGYDGVGNGDDNALRIYSAANTALITFENGGNIGLGVTNPTAPIQHTSGASLTAGGTWASASSRSLKENLTPVDGAEMLARLARMPITRWNYKAEPATTQHIGPMAEDFYELFQVGENDRTISDVDRSGVALAAIQELHREMQKLKKENRALQQRLTRLEVAK